MSSTLQFLTQYRKEYDFYDQAARLGAQLLESRLRSAGVRAIVTSRAKSIERLEKKIDQRNEKKQYQAVSDIYDDIVDLAGIRVALYFPGERTRVDSILNSLFKVVHKKEFPERKSDESSAASETVKTQYEKRFSGYWATHYRAFLHDGEVPATGKRYSEALVEIQVASVLMHAWSEVEHDLVYKPLQGPLSSEELAILDEVNGLVLAGELALERLQQAGQLRVGGSVFSNHYELAAYILSKADFDVTHPERGAGDVDLLFQLLSKLDQASPRVLEPLMDSLHDDWETRPLSEQIIDLLLADDPDRYRVYQGIRESRLVAADEADASNGGDHGALGFFMAKWIEFEKVVRGQLWKNAERSPPVPSPRLLRDKGVIDESTAQSLEPIRQLRNEVVHGVYRGTAAQLTAAGEQLAGITRSVRTGTSGGAENGACGD